MDTQEQKIETLSLVIPCLNEMEEDSTFWSGIQTSLAIDPNYTLYSLFPDNIDNRSVIVINEYPSVFK